MWLIGKNLSMTKSELVAQLMGRMPALTQKQVDAMVSVLFEEITRALERGDRVELRGFGSFFLKERNARIGCDPRTGKNIAIDDRCIPFFRAGKNMLEFLNK